jgi:hypothetical protein
MIFDVRPQFGRRGRDFLFSQMVDDALVAFDAFFPFGAVDAVAEPLEEDLQQIAERDERLESARFQDQPMKLDVELDPGLQIAGGSKAFDDFLQRVVNRRVFRHPRRNVRQHAGLDDDARFDELTR